MLEAPTIFWGYSFQDSGVLRTIKSVLEDHAHDIWVQCMPSDKSTQQIFSQAGCNLIICDTEQLLDWISKNVNEETAPTISVPNAKIPASLKQFSVPSIYQSDVVSMSDFYRLGKTYWYNILDNHATELKIVNDLYDKALKSKNVILVGSHFSGKTTSLMQLACKVSEEFKLYLVNPTIEEAKFILHHIGVSKYWIFIEDCTNDIEVYRLFARKPNITLIGECDEYSFESAKHVLGDVQFAQLSQCDISHHEALSIFDNIPASLRLDHFTFKRSADEKYSMLELMMQNVRGVITKKRIDKILLDIFEKDRTVFATIILAVYLTERKSALSTDIMWSFFNAVNYSQIRTILERTNSFLSHLDVCIDPDLDDQDYFQLRSKFFLSLTSDILQSNSKFKKEYERVIRRFIKNVPPIKIYNYHVFKRQFIDSEFIYKIFKSRAVEIYEEVYNYDKNPFVLQQWALYYSRCKDYKSAFGCIDRAIQAVPNNFSMQNSKAIILFEANRYSKTDIVLRQQRESMDILKKCYLSDKKKLYHAQKYADFAIFLAAEKGVYDYTNQAFEWLTEASANTIVSSKTKTLLHDLADILEEVGAQEDSVSSDNKIFHI